MPWRECAVPDERLQFVILANQPASNVSALCCQFGVSRQTGYKWLGRYREAGAAGVVRERSRRPRSSPRRTPAEWTAALIAARRERPDWGARKLLTVLRRERPELPVVSSSTAHRILLRENLVAAEDRHRPALQRFERAQPNELWQMDFKGPPGFNQGIGPLSILDDHSRYLLALQQVGSTRLSGVRDTLEATFINCGLPEYLLVDHGTPWYNGYSPWGWSELSVWILRQGIRMVLSGVRHPETQGKVERMHEALQLALRKRHGCADRQCWLDEFRHEYNHLRPHEGIGMQVPASRWNPSPRPYQPAPQEWIYPAGWLVHGLAGEGQLCWLGRRWEISRALRGQQIALEVNGDRVLVHYCNITLREFDLRSGANIVLPVNPFRLLQG
jgi:transposase InsO family protein